jgi:hypothetical protein
MPDEIPAPFGPRLDVEEQLYRILNVPGWWNHVEGRVSTAAFSYRLFSVDIARLTTPADSMSRVSGAFAIVSFRCGDAIELGFDPRHEADSQHPDNVAHAHVYMPTHVVPEGRRKKVARRLADRCTPVVAPPPGNSLA